MASFNESELESVNRAMAGFLDRKRSRVEIRDEVDLGYRIDGQSVVIMEIRPAWRGPAGKKLELLVAKATYVRKHDHWRVFWQRADLKWHRYEPAGTVRSIDDFIKVVEEDKFSAFFG